MSGRAGRQRIIVLGATGSVGRATLDLVARQPERFEVVALVAQQRVAELANLALRHRPRVAVIGDESGRAALREAVAGSDVVAAAGRAAVIDAASMPADIVMAAISGAAGLAPTLAAVRAGTTVALANKECLVSAGGLFMAEAARHGTTILPVDSEHNAIFQVLEERNVADIEKIVLTASGGPFRTWSREAMARATPGEALRHPNWQMGDKITIDSATLMNKGLEVIEASHLFPVPAERLEVVVHPQSVVHGLVGYSDGSLLAQLGSPDMRTPIAYCLNWPARGPAPSARLDLAALGTLTFEQPDLGRFPALAHALAALRRGAGAPTVLNAANEVAVAAFLAGRLGFLGIAGLVDHTLEAAERGGLLVEPADLEAVEALDAAARRLAEAGVHTVAALVS
jgi:1-deoxy-D-xylulose-5-phosphate reductoisomerase